MQRTQKSVRRDGLNSGYLNVRYGMLLLNKHQIQVNREEVHCPGAAWVRYKY
jgi:hypothetical protein